MEFKKPTRNEDVEVTIEAPISGSKDKGSKYKFTPAGQYQAVVNLTLKCRSSWVRRENGQEVIVDGKKVYDEAVSYPEFSLWGQAAERFNDEVNRIGSANNKDVRVKVKYSMSRMETRIWGDPAKASVSFRASSMEITGVYAFNGAPLAELSDNAMAVPQDDIEFN
jgi:hypothetical protein